jgi:amino acid adenylation domain-containing protein
MPDRDNSNNPSASRPGDGQDWQQRAELERDLLERLQAPDKSGIPRRRGTGPCLASFAQSRLWYMDQLEPGLPLYHMQSTYRIRGPLDVTALERSVNEIIRRHEVLRTTFIAPEGQPLQVVAAELTLPVTLVDLSTVPDAESSIQALAREHVRRQFDLARGPLLRLTLLRLGPEEHLLLLAMHHIVSDGWSMNVFAHEISALYDAFVHGQPSPLPPLPIQYADFSLWQRSALQGQPLQDQLGFWKERLAGAPVVLDLPTDRPRPAQPSYNGVRLTHPLSAQVTNVVQTLATQQRVTPFMVFLAAFAIVLQRYSGQDDVVIGTPIANRTHVDLEGLIGFFINTLPIRLDLSGNPTFRELLGRVRDVALDAYEHQDMPFEKLVEELQPQRDVSLPPLFQVLFQLLNLPETPLRLAGATLERIHVDSGIAALELAISLSPNLEPPELTADYSTDLFDGAIVQRLVEHYLALLRAAIARPDEHIGYLPLLTPAERQRIVVEWNRAVPPGAGPAPLSHDRCLHQLFEEHAQRNPDAIALIFEQRQFTYREVNARANALAHDLIRRGVAPEVPAGIFIDHHPAAIVALLAILKAGGAYVPLNPDHPAERLAFILRDTGLRCVLTLPGTAHRLPPAGIEHIDIDLDEPEPTGDIAANPTSTVHPDHLAYIIYTSGSTGVPRGVLVPHRGVANLVAWGVAANDLTPDCRMAEVVSLSFDAAAFHLLMALAAGAAVYVASEETTLSPPALAEAMLQNAATHLGIATSLLAALPTVDLPELRAINTGGEACPAELVQRWAPGRRFFNHYGPTEASIMATAAECNPDGTKPSIGRPIPNTQAYILDRYLQPVPVGVTGELYLAGVGLSRGYLNQPDLTAERFIPDPFSAGPGARMYRTGDLARYLPDGNIDFLGRTDFQVKIRGFRVEPGETEAVLRRHPAVHEAIVIARQDQPGDVRLTAYAVLHQQQTATPAELQEHLRRVLPYYMVPTAVVLLESMPLTSSGKVDRRALPTPAEGAAPGRPSFVAPQTTSESHIAAIWKQVLDLEQVGVQDNFFDLGGHSLLAMRAIALIEKQLGVRLSPRDLMFQTLAQLAALCDERLAQQPKDKAPLPSGTQPGARGGIRQAIKRLLGNRS